MAEINRGLVFVITGDGKGKTTSAIGMALRAAGHGQQVIVIQFMKGERTYGEQEAATSVPGLEIVQYGLDTFVRRGAPSPRDLELASRGMERAREVLTAGDHDLVVLDEINVAVDYGLVPVESVAVAVEQRAPGVSVVLTGRYAPEEFIELADTVSEICERKHHYRAGVEGRQGIEF